MLKKHIGKEKQVDVNKLQQITGLKTFRSIKINI